MHASEGQGSVHNRDLQLKKCKPEMRSQRAQREGGGSGIRTLEDIAALAVFKTAALGH
jgi:hypothetical protein